MKRLSLLAAVLLIMPLIASAQKKETFAFVERDSTLYLDVWHPIKPRPDSACVVAVFGGGFVVGERDDELQTNIAHALTERGFIVVSPDYRLALKDTALVNRHSGLSTRIRCRPL